ncbi:uncharacterized protein PV07_00672 [Cladophialophora immunda]|uniref:Uncharacterized protein n=1 Tax=Cladophialophora immunda TaxID=569365 RepID=A0A0D2A089_9EURO|nr:uncharacterized protein PV07_00672 [Cladophialophora immunda]KIW33856.1 hypothetical protein PV07_00672 [Cladophialophora immunda]OQU94383.1 hypothetical protein CLAIMM_00744 [Cladophialophora immunda]
MANQQKKYFYPPSWDYPPGGPIALGNIITSPRDPVPPLVAVAPHELPDVTKLAGKTKVEWTHERATTGAFGIYTKFLQQIAGVGVDAGVDLGRADAASFQFEALETVELWPTEQYLRARLNDPRVRSYLKHRRFRRKRVFMINGVKTVTGPSAKSSRSAEFGFSLDAGVDATPAIGVPGSVGARINPTSRTSQSHGWEGSDDFVFAFRVLELCVKDGSAVDSKVYDTGAMYAEDDDSAEEDVDFVAEDVRGSGEIVADDQEQVVVMKSTDFEED